MIAPSIFSEYNTTSTAPTDHHEELGVLSCLDLSGNKSSIPLRNVLLEDDDAMVERLTNIIMDRLVEGHGETVFDIGLENNGDAMALTLDEWNRALERLRFVAAEAQVNCQVLITKNVGGDLEAESSATATTKDKDTGCSGKVLIRRRPITPEDVIETRIAVVGNGD